MELVVLNAASESIDINNSGIGVLLIMATCREKLGKTLALVK